MAKSSFTVQFKPQSFIVCNGSLPGHHTMVSHDGIPVKRPASKSETPKPNLNSETDILLFEFCISNIKIILIMKDQYNQKNDLILSVPLPSSLHLDSSGSCLRFDALVSSASSATILSHRHWVQDPHCQGSNCWDSTDHQRKLSGVPCPKESPPSRRLASSVLLVVCMNSSVSGCCQQTLVRSTRVPTVFRLHRGS